MGLKPCKAPLPPLRVIWLKRDLRLRDHAPWPRPCAWVGHTWSCIVLSRRFGACHHLWAPRWLSCSRAWPIWTPKWAEWERRPIPLDLRTCSAHFVSRGLCTFVQAFHDPQGCTATASLAAAHLCTGLRVGRLGWPLGVPWHEHQRDGIQTRTAQPRPVARTVVCAHVGSSGPPRLYLAQRDPLPPWIGRSDGCETSHAVTRTPSVSAGWRKPRPRIFGVFVTDRIRRYARAISKPESREGCSRLSAYLAWGNLSIRQVHQRQAAARSGEEMACRAAAQLSAFDSRLALALSFHPESLRWKTGWSLTM